jgi:hypothetical protein
MFDRFRRSAAALCILVLVAGTLLPGTSLAYETGKTIDSSGSAATSFNVPVMTDALILRPLGLAALAIGAAGAILATPIVALTRPSDIAKPYKTWVVPPARYVWVDPLGSH